MAARSICAIFTSIFFIAHSATECPSDFSKPFSSDSCLEAPGITYSGGVGPKETSRIKSRNHCQEKPRSAEWHLPILDTLEKQKELFDMFVEKIGNSTEVMIWIDLFRDEPAINDEILRQWANSKKWKWEYTSEPIWSNTSWYAANFSNEAWYSSLSERNIERCVVAKMIHEEPWWQWQDELCETENFKTWFICETKRVPSKTLKVLDKRALKTSEPTTSKVLGKEHDVTILVADEVSPWPWIGVGAGAAVAVITTVIVAFVIYKKMKKRRSKSKDKLFDKSFGPIEMDSDRSSSPSTMRTELPSLTMSPSRGSQDRKADPKKSKM